MAQTENGEIKINAKNSKNLEQIAKELKTAQSQDAGAAAVDPCAQYRRIKPILENALPFIRLIPKFGKQVADAIQMLMGIADQFCPR